MNKPYTYLIGWSKQNKYYYGVRFAKDCCAEELWVSYFTSSKHVANFRDKYGEPDIITIRKTFDTAEKARLWEKKVLKRMKVVQKDNWINLTDNVSIAPEMALKGTMSHLGKKRTMETKKKISAGCLGKKRSDSFKLLKSKSYRGAGNPAHKGFVQTPYGIFETLKDAAIAEGCAISTISVKVNNPNMINYKRVA